MDQCCCAKIELRDRYIYPVPARSPAPSTRVPKSTPQWRMNPYTVHDLLLKFSLIIILNVEEPKTSTKSLIDFVLF